MVQQRNTKPSDLDQHAPKGLNLSESEQIEARKEGAKAAEQDAAKDAYRALTDGALPGEVKAEPYGGYDESQQYAVHLELGISQFEELVAGKADFKPTETQVYGLLNLERNGQNRTPYVKAAMKRLKLKPDELPGGGPAHTNDLTNITDL